MAMVHLGRALGAGGFERLVAIKAMHAHLAGEPDFVAMFLDEARLAASIRHPNVVGTIDVQEDQDGIFIVMEYVEGPSLSAILKDRRRVGRCVPLDIALRIFLDTLAGLHAAHELAGTDGEPLRLVHRDVSPQNILVGVDGIVRITDFGIARAESRLSSTQGGQVKGKLPYMAPEQIEGHPIDRRTDVYAAGAVLWELLTNERLVRGETDGERIHKIISGPVRSPREANPAIPGLLAETCRKALQKNPSERFPTTAAFAEAIEHAALASDITIAAARSVSAFVKDLDVHDSPTDLPSSSGSRLVDRSVPRSGPPSQARSAPSTRADPEASSTRVSAVIPSEAHRRAARSGGSLLVFGAVGVLVGVAAGAFFLLQVRASGSRPLLSEPAAPAESATAAAEPSPAPSPALAPALASAPASAGPVTTAATAAGAPRGPASAEPVTTAATAAGAPGGPASAAPVPSLRAAATAARPAPEPRAVGPKPAVTRSPKEGSKPAPERPSSATSFRPKEL
jgi:serine/threonine-protein kinase